VPGTDDGVRIRWHDIERRPSTTRRSIIGTAAALAVALAAIPGAVGLAQDKPQVHVWTDAVRQPGFETYRDLVADTVDVKVEVVDIGQLLAKIQLANVAGSGWPDVVFAQPGNLALLQSPEIDWTLELTPELVGQEFLDGFGNANSWCVIEGKTYCFKNDLAQSVLWYDKSIFDARHRR